MVRTGVLINMVGLGSALLGVSALVGMLVAKTLSNASANPFLSSGAGTYNPVLALDVFLVQAATNTLLGHFVSLCCSLWLLNVVGEGKGLRFQVNHVDSTCRLPAHTFSTHAPSPTHSTHDPPPHAALGPTWAAPRCTVPACCVACAEAVTRVGV